MNNQDYEQKKRECWEEFTTISPQYKVFSFAFDRAYALGKQEKTAEGKEMLTCGKGWAVKLYDIAYSAYAVGGNNWYQGYMKAMRDLFGTKWLDYAVSSNVEKLEKNGEVEPKPAEPKFKCEDRVRIIKENHPYYGKIATVDTLVNGPYPEVLVNLRGNLISFNKSDLEPYTEPKENLCMDYEGFYRKETDEHGNKVKVRIPSGEAEPYTEPKKETSCISERSM